MTLVFLSTLIALGFLLAHNAVFARAVAQRHPPTGRFVPTSLGALHVIDEGDGPPVLFLHGASSSTRVWRAALREAWVGIGRRIIIDRPGHGHSAREGGARAATLGAQAQAVVEALDELAVQRAVVVAHSWAGALAMRMALDFPERVGGLVLLAPVTHAWPGGVSWYYRLAAAPLIGPLFAWTLVPPVGRLWAPNSIAHVFAPQPVPDGYVEEAAISLVLRPRAFVANARDAAGLNTEVRAQQHRYHEIKCPVTIISGDRDGVVWTHLHSEGTARDVAGARFILLPGVGHMPHHAASERVIEEIRNLTARPGAAGRRVSDRLGEPSS